MAHDKVYGTCENKCRVEVPVKADYDNEIKALKALVNEIISKRGWDYIGEAKGSGSIPLPAEWEELSIFVNVNGKWYHTFNITKVMMEAIWEVSQYNGKFYFGQYDSAIESNCGCVYVQPKTVQLLPYAYDTTGAIAGIDIKNHTLYVACKG